MDQQHHRVRIGRSVVLGLALADVVLWALADWLWWAPVLAVALVVILRLARLDTLVPGSPGLLALATTGVLLTGETTPWAWALLLGVPAVATGLPGLRRSTGHLALLAVGLVLLLVAGVGLTTWHIRQAAARAAAAEAAAADQWRRLLPSSPEETYRALLRYVGGADAGAACRLFAVQAGAEFAAVHTAPDCDTAVRQLATQVQDPARYRTRLVFPRLAVLDSGSTAVLAGCDVSWGTELAAEPDPGPRLAELALTRQGEGGGWLITGYRACG